MNHLLYLTHMTAQLGLLAIATDLLAGHLGRVGLSAALFAGIGGYSYGVLTTSGLLGPWAAVLVAVGLVILSATAIGPFIVRLDRNGFLLATFAAQVAFLDVVRGLDMTGAAIGLRDVPAPTFPSFLGGSSVGPFAILIPTYLVVCIAALTLFGRRTPLRRLFWAIRDDETLVRSLGIPVELSLQLAFLVHAAISGAAGIAWVIGDRYVGPDTFGVWISLSILTAVFVGGTGGRVIFMVLGAGVIVGIGEVLALSVMDPRLVGGFQQVVLNAALAATLILRPRGIGGAKLELGPERAEQL